MMHINLSPFDPEQPLSICEEVQAPRQNLKCAACLKLLAKGEAVWDVHFCLKNVYEPYYFHPQCFKGFSLEPNYQKKFLPRNYSIEAFSSYVFYHEPFKSLMANFDFEPALNLVVQPPWMEDIEVAGKIGFYCVLKTVSILLWSGFKSRLLENFSSLSPRVWILLSLSDDEEFRQRASELLRAPSWPEAVALILKNKKSSADIQKLASTGSEYPYLQDSVADAIRVYGLDRDCTLLGAWAFEGLSKLKHVELCYLFINNPEKLDSLRSLLTTGRLPDDSRASSSMVGENSNLSRMYAKAFIYRAAAMYLALSGKPQLEQCLKAMPNEVQYHPNGGAAPFIRDTIKMAHDLRNSVASSNVIPIR